MTTRHSAGDLARTPLPLIYLFTSRLQDALSVSNSLLITSSQETMLPTFSLLVDANEGVQEAGRFTNVGLIAFILKLA